MSDINHGAAKNLAGAYLKHDSNVGNLSRAYLDIDAKLTEMPSDDFSRGESYGADCCARLINDVLDGKTDGVMCEPLGIARQRLIDHLADLERKLKEYKSGTESAAQYRHQLQAELTAERQRVDRLAELVEDMYLETNKHWQIEETGKWNDQLERSFREMFQKSKAKLAIDTIMEGRDNG